MKFLKKYKLYESTDRLESLCNDNLASLVDNNFYYYIDDSDNEEYIRIELYKNDFDEDEDYNGFYWSEVSDDYEVLITLITEYKYIIDEIMFIYNDGQDNIIGKDIFDIKIDDDRLITEIRMYIQNK